MPVGGMEWSGAEIWIWSIAKQITHKSQSISFISRTHSPSSLPMKNSSYWKSMLEIYSTKRKVAREIKGGPRADVRSRRWFIRAIDGPRKKKKLSDNSHLSEAVSFYANRPKLADSPSWSTFHEKQFLIEWKSMSDKIGNWARRKWSFMRQIKKMVRGGLKKILTQIYSMEFMQSSRRRAGGEKLRPLLLFEDTKGNFSASLSPAACSQLCGARSFQRFHQRRKNFPLSFY